MTLFKGIRNYSKILLIIISFLLIILVSFIRFLTGPELALSLFYLFPIILATWKVGIWAGIFMSFTSALLWLSADIIVLHTFSKNIIPYLNETFRFIVFLIITYIISELRNALERYKELARTDPLTSIFNIRAFYELSVMEINKARRFRYPISVLYMDLDNFKEVNDNFGHNTGDKLLCLVAETITGNIRAIDIVARFGGDEFCILFSKTGADDAYTVATKLQKALLDLMEKFEWPVTFSIGLVTFNWIPKNVDEVIKQADILMYAAKKNGKNMIKQRVITDKDNI